MLNPLFSGGGASRVGKGGRGAPGPEGRGGVGSWRAFKFRFLRREPAAGGMGRAGRGDVTGAEGGGEAAEGGVGSARGAAIIVEIPIRVLRRVRSSIYQPNLA